MDLATAAEWLPDLFSWLCEQIEPYVSTIVSCGWWDEHRREEGALRAALRGAATAAAPAPVLFYLQGGPSPDGGVCEVLAGQILRRQFLVARCIDDVLGDLRPGHRPRHLAEGLRLVRERFVLSGCYQRDAAGLVIPRGPLLPAALRGPASGGMRPNPSGDRLDQLFDNLLWVRPADRAAIKIVFDRIPSRRDVPVDLDAATMRFAVAPWAEGPDSLDFRGHFRSMSPRLVCEVPDEPDAALRARAKALVERLNAEQVTVALLPELVVSPQAVEAIAAEVRAFRRSHDEATLSLIVAGSGSSLERHAESDLPFNECVVLDGLGRELWRQRKMNHYAMTPQRMRDYALAPYIVADRDHTEDAHTGTIAQVRDGRLGRMLVLICEDLAQPFPGDHILDVYRPDWVFSPVLDGALAAGRWVHQRPWQNADRFGANSLVATSLVLPTRRSPAEQVVGVGLCVGSATARTVKVLEVDRRTPSPLIAWTTWEPTTWRSITITAS